MFSLSNVTVRKFDKVVLKAIDWQINSHEHWAIVGEMGSGKTSLLESLVGKFPVVKGTKHTDIAKNQIELVAKDYSFNRIIQESAQYYQQRFNVYDAENSPTLREVLTNQLKPVGTINEASVQLPPPSVSLQQLEEVATLLHIQHLLDRRLVSLSNGETRRTLLINSFLKNPKVILLDNPYMGIDIQGRKLLHQVINTIAQSGIQIIIATSPDEIPDCITHIIELRNGQCIRQCVKEHFEHQPITNTYQVIDKQLLDSVKNESNTSFNMAVDMRNIIVSYGSTRVLDGINWQIKRGEKWALLGANGSGKSTLLSLINADNPQGYRNDYVLFDRKRGTGESIWDIKKCIGFVSPELHLYFSKQTQVYKAVASGLFNTNGLYQHLSEENREKSFKYLQLLGIRHLAEKIFHELSSGEQRQVLLARALIKNPPLLILDEPCQGLDRSHINYFRELVDEVCIQFDKTLIYVSHYPDEIPACVDKFLVLHKGQVLNN
jgi:molybdate transport system ATP-binding protein